MNLKLYFLILLDLTCPDIKFALPQNTTCFLILQINELTTRPNRWNQMEETNKPNQQQNVPTENHHT